MDFSDQLIFAVDHHVGVGLQTLVAADIENYEIPIRIDHDDLSGETFLHQDLASFGFGCGERLLAAIQLILKIAHVLVGLDQFGV